MFYDHFSKMVLGGANFDVAVDRVDATYFVFIDKSKLDSSQYTMLVNNLRAMEVDNDRLRVRFEAKGIWRPSEPSDLSVSYLLKNPVTVSINDESEKYLTTFGNIALIPLLPILIFGLKP
jgi:hypothetical protein